MNKAEKIKAEIERRYEYWKEKELNSHSIESESRMSECNHLLSMVVSLSDTEEDFGIKNVGTVWHDANNVPTKKELCLIMSDSNSGLTLNNVEVVIANPLTRRFVTCSYPHKTGKQYTVQGETPIQVDVYHSCRDYILFSDVDKWAYISDLFNLNNSQEDTVSNDLEKAATKYARKQLSNPDYPTYNDEYEMECAFEAGAQWQKQQLIDKACEWLNNFYSEDRHCYFVKEDIDNFKQAMEEQL